MTGSVALIKGRYDKGKPVGGGGMGDVFWAYDHLLQRTVVFKTLRDASYPTAFE